MRAAAARIYRPSLAGGAVNVPVFGVGEERKSLPLGADSLFENEQLSSRCFVGIASDSRDRVGLGPITFAGTP